MAAFRNLELNREKDENDLLVTFEKPGTEIIHPIARRGARVRARVEAGIQDPVNDGSLVDLMSASVERTEIESETDDELVIRVKDV